MWMGECTLSSHETRSAQAATENCVRNQTKVCHLSLTAKIISWLFAPICSHKNKNKTNQTNKTSQPFPNEIMTLYSENQKHFSEIILFLWPKIWMQVQVLSFYHTSSLLWVSAFTWQKNPERSELRLLVNMLYLNKHLIWLYPH